MKKLLSVLMTLVCLFMVMSCGEKPGSLDEDDNKKDSFEAGWWKYTITNPTTLTNFGGDSNYYYYFDDDKNLTRAGNDTYEYTGATLELYQNNKTYSFENLTRDAKENRNVEFVRITEDDLPEAWDDDDKTPPANKQRENSFIIIPYFETVNVNETKRIDFTGSGAIESDDEFEVFITENNDGIGITANAYYGYFEVNAISEGTIKIKVYNKTANCESNECEITIVDSNKNTPNFLIIGKWYSGTKYLEFYENGTGKSYFSDENNYNSFNWQINDTKLILSGDVKFNSTFSVTSDTLILDDYTFTVNNIPFTEKAVTYNRVIE